MLLASALAVSGCGGQERIQIAYPPAADLKAATEAKPAPGDDIVTSAQAAADYDAAIESWGERVSRAGARLCRWAVAMGMKGVECPPADPSSKESGAQ